MRLRKSTPAQIALKGNGFRLAINGCIKSECSDFIHGVVSRPKLILSLLLAWSALPYLHALYLVPLFDRRPWLALGSHDH
jgi:hypothetical protein